MSLIMTKQEREAFLADVHVGIISISDEGRGPFTVPIWYAYDSGGDLRIMTGRESRKGQLLARGCHALWRGVSSVGDRWQEALRLRWRTPDLLE